MSDYQRPAAGLSRRTFLETTVLAGGAALFVGCQSPTTGAPAAGPAKPAATTAPGAPSGAAEPQGWDQLVEAAKRDGEVTVYAFSGAAYRDVLVTAFEKAYPGIKVQATFAPANELVTRLMTERAANRYIADVLINGTGPSLITLKPAGALAPLRPILILPEVLDESAWFENRLWWADAAEPYTTLMFLGSVQSVVGYNTQLVDPSQFSSYRDLLDPKWKGKMVATDVRNPGPGAVPTRFIYKHPELGPPFLEQLFGDTDLTLSSDQRQMIDWLAQGRFPLGLLLFGAEVSRAAEQGLPVAMIPGERFKEGVPLGPSAGAVNLIDRAPHPNAARLYVNWLLSREGQLAWQQATRENSLRVDIPKDGLLPFEAPKPGVKYLMAGTEEYAGIPGTVISDLITKAVEKARA